MPARQRRQLLQGLTLSRHTATNVVSAAAPETELERIRRERYAVDNQEFVEGLNGVATPVRGAGASETTAVRCAVSLQALALVPRRREAAVGLGRRHLVGLHTRARCICCSFEVALGWLQCSGCGPWPPKGELTRPASKPSFAPATDAGSNGGYARYCGRRISAPSIESAANAKTGPPIQEPPSGRSTCRRVAIRQTLSARHARPHA